MSRALVLLLATFTLAACGDKVPEPTAEPSKPVVKEPEVPEPADLIKEELVVGTGAEAKDGDQVKVNYTGRLLKNNFMFDTSVGKKPFDFQIGKGAVIKGWDQGVAGMKIGGKRKLTIPSRLGYGDTGSPPKIPPKATLVFEVELLAIGADADAGAGEKAPAKDSPAKDKKKAERAKTEKK